MKVAVATCLSLLICLAAAPTASGQTISVRELLQQEKNWSEWARTQKKLHVSGRYDGRLSKQFRLTKWSVIITPSKTTVLPDDVESGQRLIVSGVLKKSGSRYFMDADRIAVGTTDAERFRSRVSRIPNNQPELIYPLADEYEVIQKFYEDEELVAEIAKARADAFSQQRTLYSNNPSQLKELAANAVALGVSSTTITAIKFQSVVLTAKLPKVSLADVIAQIKASLPGWDKPNAFLDSKQEVAFLQQPVEQYEAADESTRRRMHRRLYRSIRLPQILQAFKPDGSNGLTVAETIATDLPEEAAEIARLKKTYVEYRIKDVPRLTRKQLEDLDALLREFNREEDTSAAIAAWLKAQEARRNNGQLDGLIATADEYLFAFERWKNKEHRDRGLDLLKRAWLLTNEAAPKEAAPIARRLEQYGWTWLDSRWMTNDDIASLPRNDVALAMREGRVVEGMKYDQIVNTLGQPSKKIRLISSGFVQEIWVFGEAGSSSIVVHLTRSRFESPEDARATLVAKGFR